MMDYQTVDQDRRRTLLAGLAILLGGYAKRASAADKAPREVLIDTFSAAGTKEGSARVPMVVKTEAEWKALLSPEAYAVARREGTERAGSGKYDHHKADGLYRCICCETALFDSKTKFDSGTGWPSFWQSISRQNVAETTDRSLGMERTAVSCRRCDAHLGHVFDDGPRPTGLRYCMNSVSLNFVPRS